ncbi:MAG: ABC transporter substrate-binding protein [Bacteroidales bacterium]|nr:ABC transporter substrate-binding protein [Bacteroidales bacterium]MDZ4203935.1 ABC transporter substrate-binding protein [Bacteroidales bacterium]
MQAFYHPFIRPQYWRLLRFAPLMGWLFTVACTPGYRDGDSKKIFRYNESSNITSLDPAFARSQANIWGVNQLFNGLVQLTDNLEVAPCIAKDFMVSADGLSYTFLLRNDVYFHDSECFVNGKGRKVTVGDFIFSFFRITDPTLISPGAWVFRNVRCLNGKPDFIAVNDTMLTITLQKPFPAFMGLLSMQYCSVVPHEAVEYYGPEFRRNPVGTGPFKLKMWIEGMKMVMVKNENYFEKLDGQPLPLLDAVAITFIVDKQTAFLEFIKGNLDFMSGIDASYKDELITRSGQLNPRYTDRVKMITQPYLNTEYLAFQINPAKSASPDNPLLIKEIRQAINMGFDRVKMMRYLRNNIGTPGIYGFVPPGLPSFDSTGDFGYHYDPDKARQLIALAGYPEGRGLPEITIATNASYLDLTRYFQHQLNEIGIRIKIEVSPPATLREMIAQGKVPFFRASWIADYPDTENYLSLFYSPNFTPAGPNYTHFTSVIFDKLYQESLIQTNDSLRYRLYREMDSLIMESAPVVVLYYDQVLRFVQNGISGIGSNAMNLLHLKKVDKSQDH